MRFFAFLAVVSSVSLSQAFNMTYNGGMNTLPQAQGWTYVSNSGLGAPTVTGGVLSVNSTQANTVRFYDVTATDPTSFSLGANISGLVQIDSSNLVSTPNRRAGFYLAMTDSVGRVGHLGITDTGVFISTALDGSGSSFVSLTTTDRPHFYNLTAVGNVLTLYVDGAAVTSTAVGAAGIYGANDVWFADGSSAGESSSKIHYVNFSQNAVPEPASLAALGLGVAAMLRRRRRNLK
ncbi:MAG: PEP-CTERM sorting domain-containing protein [Fimbriimonadaceae bacterium]